MKNYYLINKEKYSKRAKKYYLKNKLNILRKVKLYRLKNVNKIKKHQKEYFAKNKIKIALYRKEYQKTHKKQRNLYLKIYRLKNKEKLKKYFQKYRKTKKAKRYQKLYRKIYRVELNRKLVLRLKRNIDLRIASQLRKRVYEVLKGNPKLETTMKLVGCSIEFLKAHLQAKFKKGMSWKNYGKWHIDHIRPCASFDLSKPSEQRKCFHYTNLQPLWAKDNQKKYTHANY